ncbi:MAG: single-stranded-DNA-specific exonuclease RecJ [Clostridia bacterium]|nr:single-stranded-DNA-specific exonuclease RecJ [Clostridia bacterium]
MNLKITKKKCNIASDKEIRRISDKLNIDVRLVELLFIRGVNTEEAIHKFLTADVKNLNDPFLMIGMKEAVNRIKIAIDNHEKIIVFGDYDADGVCSSAILALYFKSVGVDVIVHIPDRIKDGYGLSVEGVESLIEEHCPDLILTCDCGISGVNEVEYIKDLGVDVIVTDHHEPGKVIPDCIVVNPKQEGDPYPDKYLCGAGVALKLVQALCEDDLYKEFLDLAAVATIADLVPLFGENRLIVQLGLKAISSGECNLGLKLLLSSQNFGANVSSSDIAYKIAPRINAAGRMGDAYRAFEMLTSSDVTRIKNIITEIEADNARRKEVCDEIYAEAEIDIQSEDLTFDRAIILSNPSWAKGVTGIAAARFAGDYNRPTFILVDKNEEGVYKGTARGIAGINIFDALSYASDVLIEFGGHSGAAGFSLYEENIPAFKQKINEYMLMQDQSYFLPSCEYDIDVEINELNKKFLSAMNYVEPTGYGNTKPMLKIITDALKVTPCKNPQHTSVQINKLQTYAFNYYYKNQFLMGDGNKEIVLELTEGLNGGVSGYIKAVAPSELYINDSFAMANYLSALLLPSRTAPKFQTYDEYKIKDLFPDSIYGTLFICADRTSYNRIMDIDSMSFVIHDYTYKSEKNNYSGIIVSPNFNSPMLLGNYSRIVFVDEPPSDRVVSYLNGVTNATIYVPSQPTGSIYKGVVSDRSTFAKYYSAIVNNPEVANDNIIVYYKRLASLCEGLNPKQFVVVFAVFVELGFVKLVSNNLIINKGVQKPLTDSSLYNQLLSLGK